MPNPSRVEVLQGAEELVHEVAEVLVRDRLVALDDPVQVGVHELRHLVHVVELGARGRRLQVDQVDDVVVLEQPEQLDLAQRALGVLVDVERVDDLL
eukprot:COSAG04_NODE_8517_length_963_cov_1.700231_1_plen_96_part_10